MLLDAILDNFQVVMWYMVPSSVLLEVYANMWAHSLHLTTMCTMSQAK